NRPADGVYGLSTLSIRPSQVQNNSLYSRGQMAHLYQLKWCLCRVETGSSLNWAKKCSCNRCAMDFQYFLTIAFSCLPPPKFYLFHRSGNYSRCHLMHEKKVSCFYIKAGAEFQFQNCNFS